MAFVPDDQVAPVARPCRLVYLLESVEFSTRGLDGEYVVVLSGYDDHGPWREQAHDVGHFGVSQKAGDVVVGTVVDRHDGVAEGAEVAGGHGIADPGEHRRREHADRASTRVSHNADARPVDVVAGRQVVESAVHVEHPLADQGAA